jgi:hypothetical protein
MCQSWRFVVSQNSIASVAGFFSAASTQRSNMSRERFGPSGMNRSTVTYSGSKLKKLLG